MPRALLFIAGLAMTGATVAADPLATAAQDKLDKQLAEHFADPKVHRPGAPPPQRVLDRAKQFHPSLALQFHGSGAAPSSDFVWSSFYYESESSPNRWPYGFVHVLWHLDSSEPVWALDWGGDFQPHSRAWIDFDGDGQKDLFFFAGFEDVFSTYVYLWRVKKNQFSANALVKVYSNGNDYSVLLDMDKDGRPEILDSGHSGDSHVENGCGENDWDRPEIPKTVQAALGPEYRALSRTFEQFNFTYNMPDDYPAWSVSILDPIKILRIEKGGVVDVTERFPDHLQWRLDMLREIRKANTGKCLVLVDSVISYINGRLANARPNQPLHHDASGGLTAAVVAGERRR